MKPALASLLPKPVRKNEKGESVNDKEERVEKELRCCCCFFVLLLLGADGDVGVDPEVELEAEWDADEESWRARCAYF